MIEDKKILSLVKSYDPQRKIILIKQATKKGYIECSVPGVADFSFPTSKLRRGRVQGGVEYALL